MQRQSLPHDPDLHLRPTLVAPPIVVVPPVAGGPPTVVPRRRRGRPVQEALPMPMDMEAAPEEATAGAGVEPRPHAAGLTVFPAAVEATTLWPSPVPTFSYLAGAAGSGKTFAAKAWQETEPGLILCATTGIAAINLGGETINSVLGYFDTASLQEQFITGFLTARLGRLWKSGVRRIILDEVSMLAGDQLTYLVKAVDEVNGRGYVLGKWDEDDEMAPPQMGLTLVGDFLQLSPVKATYAFESPEWERFAPHVITLTEIRRQADAGFIEVLRAARQGRGEVVAEYFRSRNAIHQETDDRYDGPTIVAKNESVDRYNYLRMSQLTGAELRFGSCRWGKLRSEWGQLEKPPGSWGIPQELGLKIGALVMVLANTRNEAKRLIYVNGDLGTIVEAEDGAAWVALQRTGETVKVEPVTRQVKVPADSARRKELREKGQADKIDGKWEIAGEITYLPLRVAYASTTHKSQGLSLDKVQINIRDPFFKSPGMLYVALSRARSFEGLRLVGSPNAIIERCTVDQRVKEWL